MPLCVNKLRQKYKFRNKNFSEPYTVRWKSLSVEKKTRSYVNISLDDDDENGHQLTDYLQREQSCSLLDNIVSDTKHEQDIIPYQNHKLRSLVDKIYQEVEKHLSKLFFI